VGGGGKKGEGGGGQTPSFQLPAGVSQGAASETGLGNYSTALLNPLAAMTSWASSLATGQQVSVPNPQAFAIQAGPQASTKGGNLWNTQFDPVTGLVTYTNPKNPAQTWEGDLGQAQSLMQINPSIIQQWQDAHQQYQQYQQGGGSGLGAPMGGIMLPPDPQHPQGTHLTASQVQQFMLATPEMQQTVAQSLGTTPGMIQALATDPSLGGQTGAAGGLGQAGPELTQAWADIQAQQQATGQMPGIMNQAQQFINASQAESAKFGGLGDVQQQQAEGMISKADPMYAEAQKLIGQADPMYNRAQTLENQAQQLYGVGYNELSAADKKIVDANALVTMTTTGQGLFPAQQAMIDQARQSEETQLASTLGGVGLGRSTQLDQLKGAADLASAGTAGQLQQGNIQAAEQVLSGALGQQAGAQKTLGLSQTQQAAAQAQTQAAQAQVSLGLTQQEAAQRQVGLGITQEQVAQQSYALQQAADKLTLAGQGLLANEQAQLTTELQNITTQSTQMHQVLWNEAMQGYGVMGNIIQGASQAYGLSLSAYSNVLNQMEQQNSITAQAQQAAMQADQQGTSSLFSGLGSLFGQGGAGSNLLGGLGGLFGGGAAAGGIAAGGAAAAAGAAGGAGASGIGVSAAITAVGAILA
jgi:hypothetical protein